MPAEPEAAQRGRLPATFTDGIGRNDYTDAGQADADLASALMALDAVLKRNSLTPAQRRDIGAAQQWTRKALRAVSRHMDYGATDD